ncbi:MAG: DUF58 domain-containing protein [Candidatus Odinarchaeia archaeon]
MFSKRGQLILLIGIFLLTGGFSATNYYLIAIGAMLIFSVTIGLPFFKLTTFIENLSVERKIDRVKVFAKDFLHVKIKVKNKSGRKIRLIEITDIFPETFNLMRGKNTVKTAIEPHKEVTFSYIIQPRMRGDYKIGPLKITIYDRLKFNFESLEIEDYTDILVYPSYEDIRRMEILANKRTLGMLFGIHRTRDRGIGTDFFGIRQYVPSDELKLVDWKASARTGKLMTREFETERNIKVVILIDAGGTMGAGELENNKLEYAIRAAVLLTYIGLERRDEVGLAVFSEDISNYVKPASGRRQIYKILEALAKVKASGISRLDKAVRYIAERISRAALLILLSDLEGNNATILNAAKLAKASNFELLVISPFSPWFEAGEILSPLDKALSEAVAEEFYENRIKISRELKKMNIDVINVGPDDFLPVVISQYLKAKKRGVAIT